MEVLEQPGVLLLDARALQQVVLRLLGHGLVQVMALGDLDGATEYSSADHWLVPQYRALPALTMSDIAHTVSSKVVSGLRAVAVQDVDEVQPEPVERAVDGLEQVLPRFSVLRMFGP